MDHLLGFWNSLIRRRQLAQEFIEFSLAIAAVAFVGMVGLNVLGGAEARLLGAPGGPPSQLNPPAPPQNFFYHQTTTTVACTGGPTYLADNVTPIHCVATVRDTDAAPTNPDGSVQWYYDGTLMPAGYTCNSPLTPSGTDSAVCALNYVPSSSDIGTHGLYAAYVPGDHAPSDSRPGLTLTIAAALDVSFTNCNNPTTQFGTPVTCGVHLTDKSTTPASNRKNEPVTVTAIAVAGPGSSYFSCYTNNNPPELVDPTKCPNPGSTWTCTTDNNGDCAQFEYRMTLPDTQATPPAGSSRVQIWATALGQTGAPQNITINPNTTAHASGVLFHCAQPNGTTMTPPLLTRVARAGWSTNNSGVYSESNITSNLGADLMVNCTALVVDLSVNPTTFDIGCNLPPNSPSTCNVDTVETTPPLGTVTILIFDKTKCGQSHVPPDNQCDPATDLYGTPPQCTLGHAVPPIENPTVPSSVYPTAPPGPNTYYPGQPTGQKWNPADGYATWCSQAIVFPKASATAPGRYVVRAHYNGFGSEHADSGVAGFASQDMTVDIFP